jgi:hypothetical protein
VSETDYLSVIRTLDATRRRGVISQGDIAEPRCGVTSLARRDEAPPLQPGPAALVTRVSPSRPGDGADGQVADLLGSRPGCDGPLKFRPDHSMGAGQKRGTGRTLCTPGAPPLSPTSHRLGSATFGRLPTPQFRRRVR